VADPADCDQESRHVVVNAGLHPDGAIGKPLRRPLIALSGHFRAAVQCPFMTKAD